MLNIADLPTYLTGAFVFIFGLIIGSFLNVVIYRLPREESIVFPGSHCPSCNYKLRAWDNIPVVSYLLLRGKCRKCSERISPVYPMVELLVAALYLTLFIQDGITAAFFASAIFVSMIVPLVFIDYRHQLLLNVITYPGIVLGFVLRVAVPSYHIPYNSLRTYRPMGGGFWAHDYHIVDNTISIFHLYTSTHLWPTWAVSLAGSLLGALIGGGTFWLIREVYFRVRHREGMGLGDIKMMFMVGAFLGWQLTVLTMFAASLTGSIVGLLIIGFKRGNLRMEIPFGVFLGAASIFALMFGESIIQWYIGLLH